MKIAVATDFSDRSREALPVAASLARKFSAELFVVYQCELALLTSPPLLDVEQIFQAADEKRIFIAIGTGGPTGVYFVVGNSICRMVHKEAAEGRNRVPLFLQKLDVRR